MLPSTRILGALEIHVWSIINCQQIICVSVCELEPKCYNFNNFFSLKRQWMNGSASYEKRNDSAESDAQLVPTGMIKTCCKAFLPNTTKMLSIRKFNILITPLLVHLFIFKIRIFLDKNMFNRLHFHINKLVTVS